MRTQDARLRIDDLAVLRGYAIYEGITTVDGVPFMLAEHLDRLYRSAEALRISVPHAREEIAKILHTLGEKVPQGRGDLRVVISGGVTEDGITPSVAGGSFFAIINPLVPLPPELYENGATTISLEHVRMYPKFKSTNYITAVLAQEKKRAANAQEILYVSGGEVLEASTSNLCIVKDGVIITPKEKVLPGITRMKVLELSREQYTVEERAVSIAEFYDADEVFLTSSFKDVLPIVSCDGKVVGGGVVGAVTKNLIQRYQDTLNG